MVSDENCTYSSFTEIGVFNDNTLCIPKCCERQYDSMEHVKPHKTQRLRNTDFIWYRRARNTDSIFDFIVLLANYVFVQV